MFVYLDEHYMAKLCAAVSLNDIYFMLTMNMYKQ